MVEVPPFAVIEYRAVRGEPVRVLVNDQQVGEFETIEDANACARALNDQRITTERMLKADDPARYWRLRSEAQDAELARTAEDLAATSSAALSRFFDDVQARYQKKRAGRTAKPPRRAPLRWAIVEAMRPLRQEGLTLHEVLTSLAHSPPGALRMRKQGAAWHCENEDEDWPPELLTREQLGELYKDAGK